VTHGREPWFWCVRAYAVFGPRGARGTGGGAGCGRVELADGRSCPAAVCLRSGASVRRRATPRDRRRRGSGREGRGAGGRDGDVRGHGALLGQERHDRDPRRLRRHAHPPRLDRGCQGRGGGRGRRDRDGRAERRPRGERALRPSRRPARRAGPGLPRPAEPASAARGGVSGGSGDCAAASADGERSTGCSCGPSHYSACCYSACCRSAGCRSAGRGRVSEAAHSGRGSRGANRGRRHCRSPACDRAVRRVERAAGKRDTCRRRCARDRSRRSSRARHERRRPGSGAPRRAPAGATPGVPRNASNDRRSPATRKGCDARGGAGACAEASCRATSSRRELTQTACGRSARARSGCSAAPGDATARGAAGAGAARVALASGCADGRDRGCAPGRSRRPGRVDGSPKGRPYHGRRCAST
jgi:hypothetical protein